jgi:23S rRNA pseudouridine2605 synthase
VAFIAALSQDLSMARTRATAFPTSPRFGVARVISKRGLASRTTASEWVRQGRVRVNDQLVRDPEFPVRPEVDTIRIEGLDAAPKDRIVLMLNKPRGLVTTTRDEKGRETVYRCLEGSGLPWLAPVGRLDKASEGLLLFSNDPVWAGRITSPDTGPLKTYHVQINRIPDSALLAALVAGVDVDGDHLRCHAVRLLRAGDRHAWLEIVLDEGRNRQIRRLLESLDLAILRLVRVAIGALALGELPKGAWRRLADDEIDAL